MLESLSNIDLSIDRKFTAIFSAAVAAKSKIASKLREWKGEVKIYQ